MVIDCIINRTADYSYIVFLIGTLLTIIRTFLLVYVLSKSCCEKENCLDIYCETMACTGVVYVLFTIAFIILPKFKTFWLSKVIFTATRDYYAYEFRYSLNGFAAFASSTISSIIVLICAYLLVKNSKESNWIKYLLYYIINIVGCFFYGRICIFAMMLSAIYILYFMISKRYFFKIALFIIMIAAGLYGLLIYLASVNDSFLYWKNWSFAIFNQIFSKTGITDYSVTHMLDDMYFMPELKTIIIGDGKYMLSNGNYYKNTDVGILRSILFFGIPGLILNTLLVVYPFKKVYRLLGDKREKFLLFLILIMWLILELKGEAYQRILQMILPIYYVVYHNKVRYKKCL